MRLRRLCFAALASGASLLTACAAPSSAPTSTPAAASTPASDLKVTLSDCEEPPLGSRVSRKCPHGQMKGGATPAAPAETTTK